MNVLPFGVKDHHAAVVVAAGQVKAVQVHLLEDDLLSENAEVACDDEVIVLRLPAKVFKMLPDGIDCGRVPIAAPMLLASLMPKS